jgi:hypothetical protein
LGVDDYLSKICSTGQTAMHRTLLAIVNVEVYFALVRGAKLTAVDLYRIEISHALQAT